MIGEMSAELAEYYVLGIEVELRDHVSDLPLWSQAKVVVASSPQQRTRRLGGVDGMASSGVEVQV